MGRGGRGLRAHSGEGEGEVGWRGAEMEHKVAGWHTWSRGGSEWGGRGRVGGPRVVQGRTVVREREGGREGCQEGAKGSKLAHRAKRGSEGGPRGPGHAGEGKEAEKGV